MIELLIASGCCDSIDTSIYYQLSLSVGWLTSESEAGLFCIVNP